MSSTALKIIALILMLIDHIGEFIPDAPIYLRWIGRFSAPIFFFCMAESLHHTHNFKVYLIRLYSLGVIMAISNTFMKNIFETKLTNNIFITLFISAFLIYIINTIIKDKKRGSIFLSFFILWQIVSTLILIYFDYNGVPFVNYLDFHFYSNIFFNCIFNEGGIFFVVLGIFFYFTHDSKLKLTFTYFGFSFIYTILYATNIPARIIMKVGLMNSDLLYYTTQFILCGIFQASFFPIYGIRFYNIINYYWMVIGALPFILLYNGKKGHGYKYFFYIFYPLHIYILYIIGYLLK